MTTSKPLNTPVGPHSHEPPSQAQKLEDEASLAAGAGAGALGAVKVAAVVVLGLLVWPPLAVIFFVMVVPALVVALVVGLLVAVLSTPYLLVHHFRGEHEGHLPLLAHRIRRAGRALIDLAPHRIVADVRRGASGG
ncbi:MAG: hypothetical protein ACXVUE_07005 [Solirubrobacteraceae bacterium]